MLIRFFLGVFLFLGLFLNLQASPVSAVTVQGNQRIETGTVLSHAPSLKVGKVASAKEINDALKDLYKSEYFSDVNIKRNGSVLIVEVVENPSINRIAFEGNKKVSDKILHTEMKIQPRQLLNKAKTQHEVERILAIYRAKGCFGAKVIPQIIKRDQNRVDIIFEITEGKIAEIKKILFIGNKKFSDDQLRSLMMIKESKWWRFFSSSDVYDPDRLEVDKDNLRKFYLSKGYADFKVIAATAELVPNKDGFIITFSVDEGERYRFNKAEIKTEIPTLKLDQIQDKIKAQKGDWYSSLTIERDTEVITAIAGDYGYAFVDVRPIPKKNEQLKTVDIVYYIEKAPKVFINQIKILGNTRTIDAVVRRQLLVAEGDAFNATKLRASDRNVENLGFFKKVDMKHVPVPSDPEKANIDVEVEEQSTGEINFSMGYNTSGGPFGMIKLLERNLFGRAYQFNSTLYYGKKSKNLDISLENPYFLDKDLLVGLGFVRGEENQESESSYNHTVTGVRTWMGYSLAEFLTQQWSYSLMEDRIGSIASNASTQVRAQAGQRTASIVGHALTYDKRDFKFSPTEGYVTTMHNNVAGVGGNVKYFKNTVGGAYYHTLFDDLTLSAESEVGAIQPLGGQQLRIVDKFVLGGTSLRGFEFAGVGPRAIGGNADSLGGDRMFTTSFQGTFPLGASKEIGLKGEVFLDMGTAWDTKLAASNSTYNYKALRMASGFGLSWASPFGLIRLDFGFPIVKKPGDKTSVILLNFGTGRF
ncbi:MAG: outer membrane protein assembly factor BamA [Alphaproteobacteria bacterium]